TTGETRPGSRRDCWQTRPRSTSPRRDASELPSSYKKADAVVRQIKAYDLAEIEDYIDPYGCIMAGDIPAPWMNKRKKTRGR
ncbi:MAG: hypothetical protein AAFV19_14335, partial [Pseudomonadota bacterium]